MSKHTKPAREAFEALLTPDEIALGHQRGEALIREYDTLQELRKALNLTQVQLAERMGIAQKNISRMENSDDLLLSTLANVIASMGGELELRVNFPGRAPAILRTGHKSDETELNHGAHPVG